MTIFVYQSILISLSVFLFIKLLLSRTKNNKNKLMLPPSPPALPVIGHLHLLKKPLHHSLVSISEKYGPITFLESGSRKVLVISSLSLAEQCFTTDDMAFANRPHLPSAKRATFDYKSIGAANYGPHWRNVRQIAATELLSTQRRNASSDVRVGEVCDMARRLFHSWNASAGSMGLTYFEKVSLKGKLFQLSLNVMMTMIAGKRFYGDNIEDLEESKRFREAVEEFFSLAGSANAEDSLPFLKFLGMAKATKKLNNLAELTKESIQKLIDEHKKPGAQKEGTMMANMLELQKENPEKYTDTIILIIAAVSNNGLLELKI